MKDKTILISWNKRVSPLVLAALVLGLLVWFIPSQIFPISWDFRNNLWGPAYLLVHQMSPYHIQDLFEISNAIWMPMMVGLFAPIGFLPLQWASNGWLILNLAALSLLVIILARPAQKTMIGIPLVIVALAIFPATITHFVLGQVSLVIGLILLLLINYRSTLPPVVIGLLITLSFTKPQLVVLFLPAYLIIYTREQGLAKLFRVLICIAIWMVLLCLPLFILYPGWIADFLTNLSGNNVWLYPSVFSYLISSPEMSGMAFAISGVLLAIGIGIAAYLSARLKGSRALLWVMAITPIFSPVVWSWDFVLLYPLLIWMVFETKERISSMVLYTGYGVCTIIFYLMRINRLNNDQYTIWVPLFLLVIMLTSNYLRNKRMAPVGRITDQPE